MSTKKYTITQKTKSICHQSAIDIIKTMKQLHMFFITTGIEKNMELLWTHNKKTKHKSRKPSFQYILGLNATNAENKTRKLIMTINTTILNEIWKARNLFKHEQKKIPTDNITENIKRNLKEIITIHFNKHQKNNTLTTFQEKFAIQNALCIIQGNSLTFHF